MKQFITTSILCFCCYSLSASNDSIPREKQKTMPSSNGRRIPTMSNPQRVRPLQDSPLKTPWDMNRKKNMQPKLEHQEFNRVNSLTIKGKSAEDQLIDPWGFVLTDRHLNRWYRDIKGIRVLHSYSGTIGFGADANTRAEVDFTVGYQFNPIYYLGVGQGYAISLNKKESVAPTYVESKINFLDENTTPFLDMRFGYSFVGGKGLYVNPSFGFSFGRKKQAWNVSAGYSYQKATVTRGDVRHHYKYHGVVLRVGYEFNIFK